MSIEEIIFFTETFLEYEELQYNIVLEQLKAEDERKVCKGILKQIKNMKEHLHLKQYEEMLQMLLDGIEKVEKKPKKKKE